MGVRSARAPRLPPEHLREEIVRIHEIRIAGLVLVRISGTGPCGVIAVIFLRRPLRPRGVDLAAVEPLAFFRVRQKVIGAGDLLETALRVPVAWIEVGVKLLGQPMVSLADVRGLRVARHVENFVWVFHWPSTPAVRGFHHRHGPRPPRSGWPGNRGNG